MRSLSRPLPRAMPVGASAHVRPALARSVVHPLHQWTPARSLPGRLAHPLHQWTPARSLPGRLVHPLHQTAANRLPSRSLVHRLHQCKGATPTEEAR